MLERLIRHGLAKVVVHAPRRGEDPLDAQVRALKGVLRFTPLGRRVKQLIEQLIEQLIMRLVWLFLAQ